MRLPDPAAYVLVVALLVFIAFNVAMILLEVYVALRDWFERS